MADDQGRGEFVRPRTEEGAPTRSDVRAVRQRARLGGPRDEKFIEAGPQRASGRFAPPFLKAGKLVIGQTANILLYLGGRSAAPSGRAGRLVGCIQLQLHTLKTSCDDPRTPIIRSQATLLRREARGGEARHKLFMAPALAKFLVYSSACSQTAATLTHRPASSPMRTLSLFQIVEGPLRTPSPRG